MLNCQTVETMDNPDLPAIAFSKTTQDVMFDAVGLVASIYVSGGY